MQHLGAHARHFEHFLVAYPVEFPCLGVDVGIRRENAFHIGVYFAHVGSQSRCERHCRGVGTPAAERRYVPLVVISLESRDNHYPAFMKLFHDGPGLDPVDPGLAVAAVGVDARLVAGH